MVKFTATEIRDLIISLIVISFAFALLISGGSLSNAVILVPITLVVVGLGFIFHELSHKFVAIRYGYWAEYKMWIEGLVLCLVTAYFGFLFAAPGAVYVHEEYISKEENGKISIAGSITNIILALIFLLIIKISGNLYYWAFYGMFINGFLAFFNQLPIFGLDGSKVLKWNPFIWIIVIVVALGFVAIGYFPNLLYLIL
jgi:Zn-dependent protease